MPSSILLFGAVVKLMKAEFEVKAMVELGYAEAVIVPMGVVLLVSTLLFLIPRTAVLGAILLTGYLGGAVATHVHAGHGWLNILFPALFGMLLWVGLVLRDRQLSALLPLRM